MNILAIHDGHNASVALLQDGRITYAVSEERFTRIKNQGGFPSGATKRILSEAGLRPDQLDRVALCSSGPLRPEWVQRDLIMNRYDQYCSYRPGYAERLRSKLVDVLPDKFVKGLKKVFRPNSFKKYKELEDQRMAPLFGLGFSREKIIHVDHHQCHAAGAYYGQGLMDEPILCMTCDGGGDGICASVNIGENGVLRRIDTIPVEDSIAKLYALITYMMGLVPLEHEYKLMGLAPYADSEKANKIADYLEQNFIWKNHGVKWKRMDGLIPTSYWYNIIQKGIRFQRFDVVAGGFQRFIERMMVRWVKGWIAQTGVRKIALSGGIFMNVKMNKLLMELNDVESIYVLPSCGDDSNPIGACYVAALTAGMSPYNLSPLGPLYLGPRYSEREIDRAVEVFRKGFPVNVETPNSIETEVAKHLAKGHIVARYEGREEFGARALGNRSILADPSRLDVVREINQMIKCRDFWMPFAGTMTEEQAQRNLINPKSIKAPYMIMTFDSAGHFEDYQAATHPYDKTIRPQVLENGWNPRYYKILTEFERITGKRGGVLNTSFNLHGYPIVSSPQDALDVFKRSGLRHLAIGRYLISKSS